MQLLRFKQLLNNYRALFGLQHVLAPITATGNFAIHYTALYAELDQLWSDYITIFNAHPLHPNICTPIEKHPYLENHPINFKKKGLIIGTFPPFSYILNPPHLPPLSPAGLARAALLGLTAPNMYYFYGNIGSFWEYVPNSPNPMHIANCSNWLRERNLSITDIIKYCQRKSKNSTQPLNAEDFKASADSELYNIVPNYEMVENLLKDDCTIDTLYFTSGKLNLTIRANQPNAGLVNVNGNEISALSLFCRTLQELGFVIRFTGFDDNAPAANLVPAIPTVIPRSRPNGFTVSRHRYASELKISSISYAS